MKACWAKQPQQASLKHGHHRSSIPARYGHYWRYSRLFAYPERPLNGWLGQGEKRGVRAQAPTRPSLMATLIDRACRIPRSALAAHPDPCPPAVRVSDASTQSGLTLRLDIPPLGFTVPGSGNQTEYKRPGIVPCPPRQRQYVTVRLKPRLPRTKQAPRGLIETRLSEQVCGRTGEWTQDFDPGVGGFYTTRAWICLLREPPHAFGSRPWQLPPAGSDGLISRFRREPVPGRWTLYRRFLPRHRR